MILKLKKKIFYRYKSPIFLIRCRYWESISIYKISSGENNYKYFIGYLYNDLKVKPLHIILPKTIAYVKSCDGQTKWMYFLTENDDLLEKYNTIWDKVNADIQNLIAIKNLIVSLSIDFFFWKPK